MLTLPQIYEFEEVIDVRSPAEYAIDHIPGANNFPMLDDDERTKIGTLYRQSEFQAKQQGAALIASHISDYLLNHFSSRPKDWRPLIYCWRGGKRSEALAHILNQIGWCAVQLPGGYKAYRKMVGEAIDRIAPSLRFKVVCGRTGTGKSALLGALRSKGAQVLDLEQLANHRGSVLGGPPRGEQPSQKSFESGLCGTLHEFSDNKPVYVEAESRKVGKVQLPTSLLDAIRAAECVRLECGFEARVEYLIAEYSHFLEDRTELEAALSLLIPFLGRQKIEHWISWKSTDDAKEMVRGLLEDHYDPIYTTSMKNHFGQYEAAKTLVISAVSEDELSRAADRLLADE